MSDLKPCAHCGEKPALQMFNTTKTQFRIICSCGIEYRGRRDEAVEEGVAKWNRRATNGE